jgi:hypothetical protein
METADIDRLLDRHRDKLRRVFRSIMAAEEGPDPFSFPLSRFRKLSDAERLELVKRADLIAGDRADEELRRRGAAWLVLVGDEVVAESREIGSCPTPEEVLALGEERDLVAYLFEAPLVEELSSASRWTPLAGADAYPTLPVSLFGEVIRADLDTGSHGTFISAAHLPVQSPTWFPGRHLGQRFYWTPGMARFSLLAGEAAISHEVPTRFVAEWAASPFVRINPSRQALIGRNFLRAFGLELRLSAPEQLTSVDYGG